MPRKRIPRTTTVTVPAPAPRVLEVLAAGVDALRRDDQTDAADLLDVIRSRIAEQTNALRALEKVQHIHRPWPRPTAGMAICYTCRGLWPCPTWKAAEDARG